MDQELRCVRTSCNGEWRCDLMAVAGQILCHKHSAEIKNSIRKRKSHGVQGGRRPGGSKNLDKESEVREHNEKVGRQSGSQEDLEKDKVPDRDIEVGRGIRLNALGENGGGVGGMGTVERRKDLRNKGKQVAEENDGGDESDEAGRQSGLMQWRNLGGGIQMRVVNEVSVTLGSGQAVSIGDATVKKRDVRGRPKLSNNKNTTAQEIERTRLESHVSCADSVQFASTIGRAESPNKKKIVVRGSAENDIIDVNSGKDGVVKPRSHPDRPRGSQDQQRKVISGTTSKGTECLSQKAAIEEPKGTNCRIDMEPRAEMDHAACVGAASTSDGGSRGIAAAELNGLKRKKDNRKTLNNPENAARALFYSGQIIARGFGVVQEYRTGGSQSSKIKKTLAAVENQVDSNSGNVCGSSKKKDKVIKSPRGILKEAVNEACVSACMGNRIKSSTSRLPELRCMRTSGDMCGSSKQKDKVIETPRGILKKNTSRRQSDTTAQKVRWRLVCHQCSRSQEVGLILCLKCNTKCYCYECITKWYPRKTREEIERSCPCCCQNCNSKTCLQ